MTQVSVIFYIPYYPTLSRGAAASKTIVITEVLHNNIGIELESGGCLNTLSPMLDTPLVVTVRNWLQQSIYKVFALEEPLFGGCTADGRQGKLENHTIL